MRRSLERLGDTRYEEGGHRPAENCTLLLLAVARPHTLSVMREVPDSTGGGAMPLCAAAESQLTISRGEPESLSGLPQSR
jgi:hypothetical protein